MGDRVDATPPGTPAPATPQAAPRAPETPAAPAPAGPVDPATPVRTGTTTVEHVGREPQPVVTPGEPYDPSRITLPEVKIVGHVPTAFEKQQAAIKKMDPNAVIVDGVVRPPNAAVNLEGKVEHVSHNDKTGLTTIELKDKLGHKREVSFKEPSGHDAEGRPTHHPLQEMADKLKAHHVDYDKAKIAIDGKGNMDYTVGNTIVQEHGHNGPAPAKDMPVTLEATRQQAGGRQQEQSQHGR